MAAVLVADGKIEYADEEPSAEGMQQFQRRGDNQIASLELLSIAFGLSTFAEKLKGYAYSVCLVPCLHCVACARLCRRNIVVHSDNTTAEHGVRKGRARCVLRLRRRFHECVV